MLRFGQGNEQVGRQEDGENQTEQCDGIHWATTTL